MFNIVNSMDTTCLEHQLMRVQRRKSFEKKFLNENKKSLLDLIYSDCRG